MKKIIKILSVLLFFFVICSSPLFAEEVPLPFIGSVAHEENIGWYNIDSDANSHLVIGLPGSGLRLEAFTLATNYPNLGIAYASHVQDLGWTGAVSDGAISGTVGQRKKVEAVTIALTGSNAGLFDIYYRTCVQGYGWLDWASNGRNAGTSNHNFRCEGIEIVVVPKGTGIPGGRTTTPSVEATSRQESVQMQLVNTFRRNAGLPYVTGSYALNKVAQLRVNEIAQRFSHIRPNGLSFETAVKDCFPNYPQAGGEITENISIARTPLMSDPAYSFSYLTTYIQQIDKLLDPSARYFAWAGLPYGRLGYAVQIFSGLDNITFNLY